ncbi:MAG TPA: DUF885 domain-containing protein [Anaerolineales bacterium]|nr:DUF885 domain-containing protein [Anaerolineales bacterium]
MSTERTTTAFKQLIQEEWDLRMQADPIRATMYGDHRFNDRLPPASEGDFVSLHETLQAYQVRLQALDRSELPDQEQLNFDIFSRYLQSEIDELGFRADRMPISKTGGFHTDFPELPRFVPLVTSDDYAKYISRLASFQRFVSENIERMRAGLANGQIPARITLEGVSESIRSQIVADPEESLLFAPFRNFPSAIPTNEQADLQKSARNAIQGSVVRAYQTLLEFIEKEYLPASQEKIGANNLPDGQEFYLHRIRYYTSLELTPEEIHQTGLEEVSRIRAEMEANIRKSSFEGDFRTFVEYLRSDPRFYASTPEALLKEVAFVLKKVDGELPLLFKTLPRLPYGIRSVPKYAAPYTTTAYYFPSSGDGTRAGMYYVNTYDLPSRPLYEIEALSLHEAVPGHHLQIALQQELEDLPGFRRFVGYTGFSTAYIEGWALYAERLGLEIGFYQDPYSDFGRLSYEMWRACRLVVDTGMHALGWTRQQAIDFMAENTSSTLLNIANEVDRYIAWPGQALAYKIGELKIRELRARAENKLGARFDLRQFHDLLLGSGPLPLDLLEQSVHSWLNAG